MIGCLLQAQAWIPTSVDLEVITFASVGGQIVGLKNLASRADDTGMTTSLNTYDITIHFDVPGRGSDSETHRVQAASEDEAIELGREAYSEEGDWPEDFITAHDVELVETNTGERAEPAPVHERFHALQAHLKRIADPKLELQFSADGSELEALLVGGSGVQLPRTAAGEQGEQIDVLELALAAAHDASSVMLAIELYHRGWHNGVEYGESVGFGADDDEESWM